MIQPILEEFGFENGRGLKFGIEGLEIMNDDPSEVHVVYAKISKGAWTEIFRKKNDGKKMALVDV